MRDLPHQMSRIPPIRAKPQPYCGGHNPPHKPSVTELRNNGRLFPPNYLHDSWADYLYWDSVLEP